MENTITNFKQKVLVAYVKKDVIHNSSFLIVSAISKIFQFSIAATLASAGTAQLLTSFCLRVLKNSYPEKIFSMQMEVLKFRSCHLKLRFIIFIISLVTAKVWLFLSYIFGALLGVYSALIALPDYHKAKHYASTHLL